MPTKIPATMIRLSCSHFSNWPTQPLVWMKPCCSSSWGQMGTRLGSAHPPPLQAPSQSSLPSSAPPRTLHLSACSLELNHRAFSSSGSQHRCLLLREAFPDCPASIPSLL